MTPRPAPRHPTPRRRAGARIAAILALAAAAFAMPAGATTKSEEALRGVEVAIFAGGCFWCVESGFDHVPGVVETVSGYTGGHVLNPTYQQVSHEDTGHREAVMITFDPRVVSFDKLLDVYWRSVDPTDAGGQFCDRGHSYMTAIYATTPEQLATAQASKAALDARDWPAAPIVTEIVAAGPFWPAEDYHQDYYQKNPLRYRVYRWNCGRDSRIDEVWGDEAHRGIVKE
jgi:peptide-methionine (S)-S-oxide reductase